MNTNATRRRSEEKNKIMKKPFLLPIPLSKQRNERIHHVNRQQRNKTKPSNNNNNTSSHSKIKIICATKNSSSRCRHTGRVMYLYTTIVEKKRVLYYPHSDCENESKQPNRIRCYILFRLSYERMHCRIIRPYSFWQSHEVAIK